jgi:hypothetical protein
MFADRFPIRRTRLRRVLLAAAALATPARIEKLNSPKIEVLTH